MSYSRVFLKAVVGADGPDAGVEDMGEKWDTATPRQVEKLGN